ncbi:unnamed protein product [Amoebophrya sp. A120]|nr:unnamed protein product [Amoebophrya sp. A120]|eukprot:GSA120T00025311001.1
MDTARRPDRRGEEDGRGRFFQHCYAKPGGEAFRRSAGPRWAALSLGHLLRFFSFRTPYRPPTRHARGFPCERE